MPVELPLLEHASHHAFTLLVNDPSARLLPARQPAPGEQYRFHFDMTKCIGCKCCVVACNEQNGNPAAINWRRVGEIEGGTYPDTQRWHLSMGCNHCLEPSCMNGCPVNAYTKDALTGIVDHDADICIGCQYCTWNCSYGVPQYNAERGVVGKCDMCHSRLSEGQSPACVNACPEGAIAIEIVNIAEWRANHGAANAPGMPSAEDSFSTTRITLPDGPAPLGRVDTRRVRPEHPHWSLVSVLVLTQMAFGVLASLLARHWSGAALPKWVALIPFLVAAVALAAAPAHLGRPIHAWRAFRNWRRSWLSREVIALGAFAKAAGAYAAMMFFGIEPAIAAGAAACFFGALGVFSSARIYMVPARPAWNLSHTPIEFFLTAAVLGAPLVWPAVAGLAMAGQLGNSAWRYWRMKTSGEFELRSTALLLDSDLQRVFRWRFGLGLAALAVLPLSAYASLPLALVAEAAGRWLFFASVVPKNIASTYLTPGGRAA